MIYGFQGFLRQNSIYPNDDNDDDGEEPMAANRNDVGIVGCK